MTTKNGKVGEMSSFTPLQYQPFSSAVDISFWNVLSKRKLEQYMLSSEPIPLNAHYGPSSHTHVSSRMSLGDYSFNADDANTPAAESKSSNSSGGAVLAPSQIQSLMHRPIDVAIRGKILNMNTLEDFKSINKTQLLAREGQELWSSIQDGSAMDDPASLCRFLLLTFADLKHHKYYYWFAFPALSLPSSVLSFKASPPVPLSSQLTLPQSTALHDAFSVYRQQHLVSHTSLPPFFLIVQTIADGNNNDNDNDNDYDNDNNENNNDNDNNNDNNDNKKNSPSGSNEHRSSGDGHDNQHNSGDHSNDGDDAPTKTLTFTIQPLSTFQDHASSSSSLSSLSPSTTHHNHAQREKVMLGVVDPCNLSTNPGWPLRNVLVLLAARFKFQTLDVVCLRSSKPSLGGEGSGGQDNSTNSHSHSSSASSRRQTAAPTSIFLSVRIERGSGATQNDGNSADTQRQDISEPGLQAGLDWDKAYVQGLDASTPVQSDTPTPIASKIKIKTIGWERNKHNKLAPRLIDLKSLMDPSSLASSSVDLNLKLMRWRALPSLDLQLLQTQKCLLLGAGTLGCNVARVLLGWGVRNITFVDNGKVSYSNPVRQSLYGFQDCLNGGKPKAETAAANMKLIFPGANTRGILLTIPMPGHMVNNEKEVEKVKADADKLSALIQQHDAVFLLTDSRESRWLPTVLCNAHDKPCINTALGFDSYVVMRHGHGADSAGDSGSGGGDGGSDGKGDSKSLPNTEAKTAPATAQSPSGSMACSSVRLGCYFCNDVVAPADSLRDRTLDQQCTVTRPGLALIASALAVELFVAMLHHPLKHHAPGQLRPNSKDAHYSSMDKLNHGFGLLPHQLRGFLTRFDTAVVLGQAFDKCTACSKTVVDAFRERGFGLVLDALNTPTFLEDLTGLTQLKQAALEVDWDIESDSDDEF